MNAINAIIIVDNIRKVIKNIGSENDCILIRNSPGAIWDTVITPDEKLRKQSVNTQWSCR